MKLFKQNISKYQIIKISDILSDIGIICLASLVFPAIFGDYDGRRFLSGFISSLALFVLSINIRK
jgi:hypothetical protein